MASNVPVRVSIPPITQPVIDKSTGFISEPWYMFLDQLRNRTGGDVDNIDSAGSTAQEAKDEAQKAAEYEIVAGVGLEGGGKISEGVTIDAKQQSGWVASTGTGDRTTPYAKYVPATIGAVYSQTEIQGVVNALAALSARYVALEAAVFANEGIKA